MKQFFFDSPIGRIVLVVIFIAIAGIAGHYLFPDRPGGPVSSLSHSQANALAHSAASLIPGAVVFDTRGTGSMRPLFDGNAILVTAPVEYDQLRKDMIVTYFPRGPEHGSITHRLAYETKDGWKAHGDNNFVIDPFFVHSDTLVYQLIGVFYFSP